MLIFLRLRGPETPLLRGMTTAKVVVAGVLQANFYTQSVFPALSQATHVVHCLKQVPLLPVVPALAGVVARKGQVRMKSTREHQIDARHRGFVARAAAAKAFSVSS